MKIGDRIRFLKVDASDKTRLIDEEGIVTEDPSNKDMVYVTDDTGRTSHHGIALLRGTWAKKIPHKIKFEIPDNFSRLNLIING